MHGPTFIFWANLIPFSLKPCNENSLWQRHAISRLDEGETLHVVETAAGYNLLVGGEVRARVMHARMSRLTCATTGPV